MHKLYEVKEKLIDELEELADKSKYSRDDVETIKYMSSAVDHLCNIIMDMEEDEYSNAYGGSYARGGNRGGRGGQSRANDGSYEGGSYARGRGRNARRDSMGRYSREGYSRADDFAMELRELMEDAPNDRVRQKMQSIMSEM